MVLCEVQCPLGANNVWHAVQCHTCSTFRHWWSPDQIFAVSKKQRETGYPSLLFVGFWQCIEYTLAYLVRLLYVLQLKFVCFKRHREWFGNLITCLAVVLLIKNLGMAAAKFMSKTYFLNLNSGTDDACVHSPHYLKILEADNHKRAAFTLLFPRHCSAYGWCVLLSQKVSRHMVQSFMYQWSLFSDNR